MNKVYEIAQEHSNKHPEQSQKFKEEMHALYRFSKLNMETAKDMMIMKYVDAALSKGRSFENSPIKNNNLLDYANQRDINKTFEEFKGSPSERQLFISNLEILRCAKFF